LDTQITELRELRADAGFIWRLQHRAISRDPLFDFDHSRKQWLRLANREVK
jgi:hypothetical protein